MTGVCDVVVTAPDPEWLRALSRRLVEEGLCASAHNHAPVWSVYRWRGQVREHTEGRVTLHTSRSRVDEVVARIRREHPYEVPGISTRPIDGGHPGYLEWIARETAPTSSGT